MHTVLSLLSALMASPPAVPPGDQVQTARDLDPEERARLEERAAEEREVAPVAPDDKPDDRPPPAPEMAEEPMLFMEVPYFAFLRVPRTLVDSRAGGTPIAFEGYPVLHVFFINRLNGLTALKKGDPSSLKLYNRFPPAWSVTFDPVVRMLLVTSNPVRSPSWRIRMNLQGFLQTHWGQKSLKRQITGFRLSLGHHSNGQEGCPFETGQLVRQGCGAFDYDRPELDKVNRRDGDFSLNHATFAAHMRFVTTRQLAEGATLMKEHRSHTFGALGELFLSRGPGGMPSNQRKLYGDGRARLDYNYERSFSVVGDWRRFVAGRARSEIFFERGFGVSAAVEATRYGGRVSYSFDRWSGLGVFVSAYRGADYYNMLFVDDVEQVLFGAILDVYKRPRYACPGDDSKCRLPPTAPGEGTSP